MRLAYQSEGFDHQRPSSHKSSNHKATKNGLDLGDSAMFRIKSIFFDQQTRSYRKYNLKKPVRRDTGDGRSTY